MDWISDGDHEKCKSFSGALIFDEAHFAKTLKLSGDDVVSKNTSLTAKLVNQIQIDLPNARVVYVSATGASDPRHMAYMRRLGLWGKGTSFNDFKEFKESIGDSVAAMEMVAMEMKSLGMYCSRHLSFEGTKFELENISLSQENKKMYNLAASWWQKLIKYYLKTYENDKYFGLSMNNDQIRKPKKLAISMLWSAHQRFFLNLCIALKVKKCIEITNAALENDMSVVIGLFSTGESALDESLSKSNFHEELLSAPYLLAETFVKNWFPIYYHGHSDVIHLDLHKTNGKSSKNISSSSTTQLQINKELKVIYDSLLNDLQLIDLPKNPLDEIIHSLGGVSKVAEITGRTTRLIYKSLEGKDSFTVGKRIPKSDNNKECSAFMEGKKRIAIISEAASTGISLHSSNSCKNKRKRMHIVLQLPWSAEKAIQQLGRTHRSDQQSPPHYKLLITELGGERRLASVVASRLGALGALTSGDRRATSACDTLAEFVISPKYGSLVIKSLQEVVDHSTNQNPSFGDILENISSPLNEQVTESADNNYIDIVKKLNELGGLSCALKNSDCVKRFLNRLLGISVEDQFLLFS